jgi:hypothetical protein
VAVRDATRQCRGMGRGPSLWWSLCVKGVRGCAVRRGCVWCDDDDERDWVRGGDWLVVCVDDADEAVWTWWVCAVRRGCGLRVCTSAMMVRETRCEAVRLAGCVCLMMLMTLRGRGCAAVC